MHKCVVCSNSTQKRTSTRITFHSFPRNFIRNSRWLKSLKINQSFNWQRVCSDHFSNDDFKPGDKRHLWKHAVPVLKKKLEPDNSCVYDQSINTKKMEPDNSKANNLGTPRRSSRRMKMKSTTIDCTLQCNDKRKNKISTHTENMITRNKLKKKIILGHGVVCSVKNCQNRYSNSKSLSFFGYPHNKKIKEIWIKNCKIQHLVNPHKKISINLRVCGHHFEDRMFLNVDKRNRLVPNAIPTLFYDNDKNSRSPSSSKTKLIKVKKPTNIEKDDNDKESNTKNELKDTSKMIKLDELSTPVKSSLDTNNMNCCIPDCVGNIDNEDIIGSKIPKIISLFCPPTDVVNDWISILGVQLTEQSIVCEKHFKPQDIVTRQMFFPSKGLREIKSLVPGAMPKVPKCKETKRRSSRNNESLITKKVKTDIKDNSNVIETDLLGVEDSTLKPTLKSITTPTNTVLIQVQSPNKSLSSSTSTISPNFKINDQVSIDFPPNTSTNNLDSNSTPSSFEQVLPKILANSSLSITLQTNKSPNKQSSAESINIVNSTDLSKQITSNVIPEPTNILLKTNNSVSKSPQSSIEQLLSKTLANNSLSITRQSSNKQNEKVPAIDSAGMVGIQLINSLPKTTMYNKTQSNKEISSYLPTSTSQLSVQQIEMSAVDSTEVVDLTDTPNIKTEPIDINSNNDSLDYAMISNYEQLPSTISNNSYLPTTTSFNHNISTSSTSNNSVSSTFKQNKFKSSIISTDSDNLLPNSMICPEFTNSQFLPSISSPMTNNISNTSQFLNNDAPIITKCFSLNPNSEHFENRNSLHDGKTKNKEFSKKDFNLIRDICKDVVLPNLFWKSLYNMNTTITAFIQRNEFMETIKKIYFHNSLVPLIYIKSKPYEFNKPIKTKSELENLLEQIDRIEICLGDDGYYNNECIGYFDNTTKEETELCQSCEDLVKDENLYTMEAMIKDKSNKIKHLKNRISEMEIRVLQARKQMKQNKKKKVLQQLLGAINPVDFLSVLKPPEY